MSASAAISSSYRLRVDPLSSIEPWPNLTADQAEREVLETELWTSRVALEKIATSSCNLRGFLDKETALLQNSAGEYIAFDLKQVQLKDCSLKQPSHVAQSPDCFSTTEDLSKLPLTPLSEVSPSGIQIPVDPHHIPLLYKGSPDGKTVAAAYSYGRVRIVKNSQVIPITVWKWCDEKITFLSFLQDHLVIGWQRGRGEPYYALYQGLVGGKKHHLGLYDLQTGAQVKVIENVHTAFTRGGKLYYAVEGKPLMSWDPVTCESEQIGDSRPLQALFLYEEKAFILSTSKTLSVYDLTQGSIQVLGDCGYLPSGIKQEGPYLVSNQGVPLVHLPTLQKLDYPVPYHHDSACTASFVNGKYIACYEANIVVCEGAKTVPITLSAEIKIAKFLGEYLFFVNWEGLLYSFDLRKEGDLKLTWQQKLQSQPHVIKLRDNTLICLTFSRMDFEEGFRRDPQLVIFNLNDNGIAKLLAEIDIIYKEKAPHTDPDLSVEKQGDCLEIQVNDQGIRFNLAEKELRRLGAVPSQRSSPAIPTPPVVVSRPPVVEANKKNIKNWSGRFENYVISMEGRKFRVCDSKTQKNVAEADFEFRILHEIHSIQQMGNKLLILADSLYFCDLKLNLTRLSEECVSYKIFHEYLVAQRGSGLDFFKLTSQKN